MADSNFRGPVTAMGSLEDSNFTTGTTALVSISPFDGPSLSYQGFAFPDLRSVPFAKDGTAPARVPGVLLLNDFYAVDNVPQTASTTLLAAAQTATAVTALAIVTAQVNGGSSGIPSLAIGVPIIPVGTTVATTANIALDFGFATGTTAANSSTVIVNDNMLFTLGQWIVIGGTANSSGSSSTITQVTAISTSNTTTINVGPTLPQAAFSNAPIGAANLFGSGLLPPAASFGPSAPAATAHSLRTAAGLMRVMNPREMISRNVSITVGTTGATTTIVVSGWDVWGNPMVENIVVPLANRGSSTIFGKKAFKYIQSAVPTTSVATTFALGVGDVFGLPFRADEWEQTQIFWNGCQVPTSLGFSVASTISPTTNTAGDVRGTIQVSTNGTGSAASVATAQVSNNAARLCIIQNPGLWNTVYATPNNIVPLYGVAQANTST